VAVAEICGKPLDLRRRLRTTTSTTSAGPALTLSSSASTIYTTPALIVEFLHPHPPTATHPPIMPAVQVPQDVTLRAGEVAVTMSLSPELYRVLVLVLLCVLLIQPAAYKGLKKFRKTRDQVVPGGVDLQEAKPSSSPRGGVSQETKPSSSPKTGDQAEKKAVKTDTPKQVSREAEAAPRSSSADQSSIDISTEEKMMEDRFRKLKDGTPEKKVGLGYAPDRLPKDGAALHRIELQRRLGVRCSLPATSTPVIPPASMQVDSFRLDPLLHGEQAAGRLNEDQGAELPRPNENQGAGRSPSFMGHTTPSVPDGTPKPPVTTRTGRVIKMPARLGFYSPFV